MKNFQKRYHLQLIIYHLQLTTYNLSLTTYNLSLTTYHLKLTTYHLQLITYNLSLITMTTKEFIHNLPNKVHPEAIAGHNTNFHFLVENGEGDIEEYTLAIQDGVMSANDGLHGDAKCVLKAKDKTLSDIVSGKTNGMMAVFTGKLKMSNQGEMLKYAKILGFM
jgi:putative sterol carrier protein